MSQPKHRVIPPEHRIIFALDCEDEKTALAFVDRLAPTVRFFKIGWQLFLAAGLPLVRRLKADGHRVMLDLKFHDIPETSRLVCRQLQGSGADFVTFHAYQPSLAAACALENDFAILAVTVLTSTPCTAAQAGQGTAAASNAKALSTKQTLAAGASLQSGAPAPAAPTACDPQAPPLPAIAEQVLSMAGASLASGCGGIVCSAREAALLRRELGPRYGDFCIVTPGIRLPGPAVAANTGTDQQRTMTPREAVAAGVDHLVVGRPIRDAKDPLEAARAMLGDAAG